MKTIIAIDPGGSGGIVIRAGTGIVARPMPDTEGDVLELLKAASSAASPDGNELVAVVESQTGCAGKLVSAPAMFKFGRNYGFILGALQCLAARVELVTPQKWQKALSLGTSRLCASKTEWKNKLKAEAQRLFPGVKVTLATADALLLLEYYIRTNP